MKSEINNENKAKFFALYWGQKVLEYPKDNLAGRSGGIGVVGWMISTDVCVSGTLNLKPLSKISDEDAIELSRGSLGDNNNRQDLIKHSTNFIIPCLGVIGIYSIKADYLRSKGYALPWMGLSVDEMIDAGWIKLT